ncbi:MAG: threonine synthase [Leptotrichiaceae bacterium]|nr:threonine synthase [Leptotrichiaceae bacterium]MBP6281431.1 threonine synthase [Leptotrichiaceae bacterium]MBP7100755.1 threonine synthase [Leptotrichiaceae bacterium]MBP7739717.1 threonine synthase [Leptotrichiaceae bacterium]MBP9630330.1 threonine synthase [Leptotrichiaceae bacterium]
MNYKSTRGSEIKSSTFVTLHGLANDGGLYIPEHIPNIKLNYKELKDLSYQELSEKIIKLFFTEFSDEEIKFAVNNAYNNSNFTNEEIVPVYKLNDKVSFGELFHGRTLAFKDLALSLFPYLLLLSKEKQKENRKILILTATSGDTGKAALEGFKNLKGINIIVFYPKHGVSPMQEEQMRKQLGDNVDIVAINGNFDDAQNSVKYIFSSEEFKNYSNENNIMFSSANSINIGRLFPQVIYYISTYLNLVNSGTIREGEEFNVVVPTGNFGNILAGYIAKKLGIPIKKFISASNKNNVLSDFFKTGIYNKNRSFFATCSPSMDILISSNFERYLYYSTGENSERVIELMNDLYSKGTLKVSDSELTQIQEEFYGEFSNDEETVNAIKNVYKEYKYLMDPHTAVAYSVYDKLDDKLDKNIHTVIMSTAHPFKFPIPIAKALEIDENKEPYSILDDVSEVTGIELPKKLEEIRKEEIKFSKVIDKSDINNYVKEYIKNIK